MVYYATEHEEHVYYADVPRDLKRVLNVNIGSHIERVDFEPTHTFDVIPSTARHDVGPGGIRRREPRTPASLLPNAKRVCHCAHSRLCLYLYGLYVFRLWFESFIANIVEPKTYMN